LAGTLSLSPGELVIVTISQPVSIISESFSFVGESFPLSG